MQNTNDLLKNYREQIDWIDKQIVYLLSRRFEIVKQIWIIKKQNNIPPLQLDRWNSLLNNLKDYSKEIGLNPNLIEKFWNEIHNEALNIEK